MHGHDGNCSTSVLSFCLFLVHFGGGGTGADPGFFAGGGGGGGGGGGATTAVYSGGGGVHYRVDKHQIKVENTQRYTIEYSERFLFFCYS